MKILLVVDDSLDAAEPLIAFLHSWTHQTGLAHSATDALDLAATFRPDLALLDIGLPSINGWMLGTLLRGLPGLADLPIIALAGYGRPADRQKSADANFQHHLVKPIDYTILDQLIRPFEPISDEPARHADTDALGVSHSGARGHAPIGKLPEPESPADCDERRQRTIVVEMPRGVYQGHYQVGPVSPTSGSVGFVALLRRVGVLGSDGHYTALPVAAELRGRWHGLTQHEVVESLTQQFESSVRAQTGSHAACRP